MADTAGTIAKAYVQIMPSMQGVQAEIAKGFAGADSAGEKSGQSVGAKFASTIKGVLIKAGIGISVGKIFKDSLDEGAKLQQSYMGGVDTLYGDAADKVRAYANEAAKYGMTMNDYSETAVSFGAALKAAYGGDVVKAADAANTAIQDMYDNQSKMGTNIQDIQNAYQGFAKQNYTMLDNLKLGYGGTKSEMERLLADAEKISGVHYDINNLGDVYSAIHVIQGELGLTGNAASEASTTFSGSFEAMKASAQNLLGAMSTGMDIQPALNQFTQSFQTFVTGNALPMINTFLTAIPPLIVNLIPSAVSAFTQIITTILTALPGLIGAFTTAIVEAIPTVVTAIVQNFPAIAQAIITAIPQIINAISAAIPDQFDPLIAVIAGVFGGVKIANSIVLPLMNAFSQIAPVLTPIIQGIGSAISGLFSLLMANPVIAIIVGIIAAVVLLYTKCEWFRDGVNAVLSAVGGFFVNLGNGIAGVFSSIGTTLGTLKDNVASKFSEIKEGISTAWDSVKSNTAAAWDTVQASVAQHGGGIKGVIGAAVDGYKLIWATGFSVINDMTGGKLGSALSAVAEKTEAIKGKFSGMIEGAKNIVSNGLDKIKSFFSGLHLSIPNIKLPHFKLTGSFSLKKMTVPHLSVDWYAKAMNSAYVMKTPTAFGVNADGSIMAGGEAGAEVIAGERHLRDLITSATASNQTQPVNVNVTINVSGKMDRAEVRELAGMVSDEIDRQVRAKQEVFA